MANRTLFELLHKESISSTDIIPIQINSVGGVLNKVTVGQLMNLINQDNIIHVLDTTFTDAEQKLEIAEIYANYISGKNLAICIADDITIDSIISKVYILAEFIFSDVDVQTSKIYIKYNTIIDDDQSITKKENSITATILKATCLVYGDIIYATKNYITYKSTYINNLLDGKVDDSQVLTNVPAGALFTDTIYTHPNHSGDVTSTGDGATAISDNVVTNAKLADMIVNTIKGRKTNSTGDPEDITMAELKAMLELNNVTNVTQLAAALKGVANGVAELDSSGKVPSSQLPAYVDDVLERDDLLSFPLIGDTGIIYVALDTNKTYRWTGSTYTIISETLAIGETSSTAYSGDRGKTAYDHSQGAHAPVGATINDTDSNLRDRTTHTGTQSASTISDFASTVRDTVLTGLSVLTNATITATDTVLDALGKLQKQISDNLETLQGIVNSSKYTVTIGDNINSVYTITHNRNTENILVSIIKVATKENTLTAFTIVDANNITIDFGEVIGTNTYKVIVL